jgi:hypothetical protein
MSVGKDCRSAGDVARVIAGVEETKILTDGKLKAMQMQERARFRESLTKW